MFEMDAVGTRVGDVSAEGDKSIISYCCDSFMLLGNNRRDSFLFR